MEEGLSVQQPLTFSDDALYEKDQILQAAEQTSQAVSESIGGQPADRSLKQQR